MSIVWAEGEMSNRFSQQVYPPTLVKEDEALPVTEESATQEYGRQGGREY